MSEQLTYRDLSSVLGVNQGTLKRWKHEGMPAHIFGERVRFDIEEVRSWIKLRRSDPKKMRRLRGCTFNREAVIYFGLGDDGRYKIGWTSDVERRSKEERFEILATLPGDKRIELLFHELFQDAHDDLEWFHPTARLTAFVDGLIDMQTRVAA